MGAMGLKLYYTNDDSVIDVNSSHGHSDSKIMSTTSQPSKFCGTKFQSGTESKRPKDDINIDLIRNSMEEKVKGAVGHMETTRKGLAEYLKKQLNFRMRISYEEGKAGRFDVKTKEHRQLPKPISISGAMSREAKDDIMEDTKSCQFISIKETGATTIEDRSDKILRRGLKKALKKELEEEGDVDQGKKIIQGAIESLARSRGAQIHHIKSYHGNLDQIKFCGKLARTTDGFVGGILHFKLKHDSDGNPDFDICPLIDEQSYSILFPQCRSSSIEEPHFVQSPGFGGINRTRIETPQHIFAFDKDNDPFTKRLKVGFRTVKGIAGIESFCLHCGNKEYVISRFPPAMTKDEKNVLICARKYGSGQPFEPMWEVVKPSACMSSPVSGLEETPKKEEEEETGEKMDSPSMSSVPSIRLPVMSTYKNAFGSLLTAIPHIVSSKHRDFLLTSSNKCLEVNFNIVRKCYELVPISPKKLPPWIQGFESFKDELINEYETCLEKRIELGTAVGFPNLKLPKLSHAKRSTSKPSPFTFGGASAFNQPKSVFSGVSLPKVDSLKVSIQHCCIVRGWDLAQGPIICVSWKVHTHAMISHKHINQSQYLSMMGILDGVKKGTIDPVTHKVSLGGFGSSSGESVADMMKKSQWKELIDLKCRVKDMRTPPPSKANPKSGFGSGSLLVPANRTSIAAFNGSSLISISGEILAHVPNCHVGVGFGHRDRLYMFSHSIDSPCCRVLLPEDDTKDVIAKDSLHKAPVEVEKLRIGDIVPSDGWDMSVQFVPLVLREIVWKAGCQYPIRSLFGTSSEEKRMKLNFDILKCILLEDTFASIGSVGKEGYLVHGALPHSYAIDRGCSKEGDVSDDGEVDLLVHGHTGCKHVSLVEMKQMCAINRALRSTGLSGGFHPLLPKDTFFSIGLNQTTDTLRATLIDRTSLLKASSTPLVYNKQDFAISETLPPVSFPLFSTEVWKNGFEQVDFELKLGDLSGQHIHHTYVRKHHRKHYKLVYGTSQCPDSLRSTSFSPISLSDLNKMGGIPLWVCVGSMILECICYGISYDQYADFHECVSREEMLSYVSEDECKQQMLRDVESLKSGVMSVKEVEHDKEEESTTLAEKEEEEEAEKEVRVSKDVSSSSDMGTDVSCMNTCPSFIICKRFDKDITIRYKSTQVPFLLDTSFVSWIGIPILESSPGEDLSKPMGVISQLHSSIMAAKRPVQPSGFSFGQSGGSGFGQSSGGFGGFGQTPAAVPHSGSGFGGFGQPSGGGFGQPSSSFGQSGGFGGFGQTPAAVSHSGSGFGGFGQPSGGGFGQPSSSFGQSGGFGGFGQTPAAVSHSGSGFGGFGQPSSSFGQSGGVGSFGQSGGS
ncbi:hypothetical protein ADUPG1_013692, partial [Aduncisulcus paluster]